MIDVFQTRESGSKRGQALRNNAAVELCLDATKMHFENRDTTLNPNVIKTNLEEVKKKYSALHKAAVY